MKVLLQAVAVASLVMAVGAVAEEVKKAKDPVSGKEVVVAKETPSVIVNDATLYFTDAESRATFLKDPEKYVKTPVACPVQGKKGLPNKQNRTVVNDQIVYFCCAGCPDAFQKAPGDFVFKVTDPVSGKTLAPSADGVKAMFKGGVYFFESNENKAKFEAAPEKYAKVVLQ
jgi:YHS domain-containing protein